MKKLGAKKFYAVARGRIPGIYESWNECSKQVDGFQAARFKSFPTYVDAELFVKNEGSTIESSQSLKRNLQEVVKEDIVRKKLGNSEVVNDNPNLLIIYTDGSCSRNGQTNSWAGVGIYFGDSDSRNISEPFPFSNPTNQRAELYAPYRALETVADDMDVEIRTDSKYTISCVTTWFQKWEKNGWKGSTGKDVENQDIIKPLLRLIRDRKGKTFFKHVYGHQGVHGNEMADQLAVNGQKAKLKSPPTIKM
jgi:ribonuclease HI